MAPTVTEQGTTQSKHGLSPFAAPTHAGLFHALLNNNLAGRLDRATFRKIDFELVASERLSVPGEETNPDAHLGRELRSGATDRSRSSTSRSDS